MVNMRLGASGENAGERNEWIEETTSWEGGDCVMQEKLTEFLDTTGCKNNNVTQPQAGRVP